MNVSSPSVERIKPWPGLCSKKNRPGCAIPEDLASSHKRVKQVAAIQRHLFSEEEHYKLKDKPVDLSPMGRFSLDLSRNKANLNSACYTSAMFRFPKTLLLWLIMVTLPLQGLAAAVNASCSPTHHADVQVRVVAKEHQHAGSALHHHDHGGTHDEMSKDIHEHDSANGHQHLKNSSCSACAACCFGATAPPSVSVPAAAPGGSQFVLVSPAPLITSVIPAGLERPPRHVFA